MAVTEIEPPLPAEVPQSQQAQNWALFHTNRTAWAAAKELCSAASESIIMEQYIFAGEGIGWEMLGLLAKKARQGVHVRVLADAFGSRRVFSSAPARMFADAGGELRPYRPFREIFHNPGQILNRLHRKTIVCDDTMLMVGGSCFSQRMRDWRDTMLSLEDHSLARAARSAFEATWRRSQSLHAPEKTEGEEEPPAPDWSYVVNTTDQSVPGGYYRTLLKSIDSATRSIRLTTPYLIPEALLRETLRAAVRRGVDVQILIPAKSDHPIVDRFSSRYAGVLTEDGIRVFAYLPEMLHAKLAVIDGEVAAVGSFNLSIDSTKMNLENGVVSRSKPFVAALSEQLGRDFAASRAF